MEWNRSGFPPACLGGGWAGGSRPWAGDWKGREKRRWGELVESEAGGVRNKMDIQCKCNVYVVYNKSKPHGLLIHNGGRAIPMPHEQCMNQQTSSKDVAEFDVVEGLTIPCHILK